MNFALIYHYWNDTKDCEVWRDLANPIIPSIATFRANNVQVPIYVLDISRKRNDWSYFPFKLKFEVVRREPSLGHGGKNGLNSAQIKLCSRAFDVPLLAQEIDADHYAFSDCDILWYRDMLPFPAPVDGFYCNQKNNGFYYWNRGSGSASSFFASWGNACKSGIEDARFRQEIMTHYYASVFNDEAAYCYVKSVNPDLIKDLSTFDNWAGVRPDAEILKNTKNVHLCQTNYGKRRGLIALIVREFYDKMKFNLSDSDLIRMFGEKNVQLAGGFGFDQIHKARLILNDNRKMYS